MRDQSSVMPGSVSVRFQARRCNGQPTDEIPQWYVKTIDIENVLQSVTGSFGNKTFHDRAIAEFDVSSDDPLNKSSLDNLSDRIAVDFYNWLQDSFDESFPQVIAPTLDALTDTIEFVYRPENQSTRRYSSPYNDHPEEFSHWDSSISECSDNLIDGTNIAESIPCFESYGPPTGGTTSAITVPVFKNCFNQGILTQEFVRNESVNCGCGPAPCNIFCIIFKVVCPITGEEKNPLISLNPKLYRNGVLIGEGSQGSPAYCWSNIEVGAGYTVEITNPSIGNGSFAYRDFESGIFSVDETCTTKNFILHPTLGWRSFSADITACGSEIGYPYPGVTIEAQQGSKIITITTDSSGHAEKSFADFLAFDEATFIPLPLTIKVIPPSDRWNQREFTFNWTLEELGFSGVCEFQSVNISSFVSSNCDTQGDVASPYICVLSCEEPLSKVLNLEDSTKGTTQLTYQGCNSEGHTIYKGQLTYLAAECNSNQICAPGSTERIKCPEAEVTVFYEFEGLALSVSYGTSVFKCDAPLDINSVSCRSGSENPQGAAASEAGFFPDIQYCGKTFLIIYDISEIGSKECEGAYGSGGTITLTEFS